MGDGSTFQSMEDYVDAADGVLETLCYHNLKEVVAFMACYEPGLFRAALEHTSNGCY